MGMSHKECIEKSDLIQKIMLSFPKYFGPTIVIEPSTKHTASLVFMHGLGGNPETWEPVLRRFSVALPHIRFILPTAPKIPLTLEGGTPTISWYDIYSFSSKSKEDRHGLLVSAIYIITILEREAQSLKGGLSQVILGGFSQGAALSLFTYLAMEKPLSGIISLSGYLAGHSFVSDLRNELGMERSLSRNNKQTPIFMGHGTEDLVIPLHWNLESMKELVDVYQATGIRHKKYKGLGHEINEDESCDIFSFLKERTSSKE